MNDIERPVLSTDTIDRLLPPPAHSCEEIESWYPERGLPKDAHVTRIAPSPTGFMHIGSMYAALISERLAHQTGGVFYLRLEDTDRKREQEGAPQLIMNSLVTFGLRYDEGPASGTELGDYGPYIQSHRQEIYHAYIRKMLEEGRAYPCFMSPEEQEKTRQRQAELKMRPGYYGSWAEWRDRPESDVTEALDQSEPYIIRFRSEGDIEHKRHVRDLVKGEVDLPESDNDIVIMKADGLPTYHLAHVIDDHLMRTTTVIRGDEWLPSCALHIQLSEALGLEPFTYGHIAPLQKMDGQSRRKLSKRYDPEANVEYYLERGYPTQAVIEYMLNQANSDFEEWRRNNPREPYTSFQLRIERLPKNAGSLFDLQKLEDVSRETLALVPPEQLLEMGLVWARQYDEELESALTDNPDYAVKVFSIERENNRRKDIAKLLDLRSEYGYFFDDIYAKLTKDDFIEAGLSQVDEGDRQSIAQKFLETHNPEDPQTVWFDKIKTLSAELGFTPNTKEYRKSPNAFKGSVADVAMVLRVALTGRNRSPNLHELMQVMGKERVEQRLRSTLLNPSLT